MGTEFHVDLNVQDKTAEINDLSYKIDDREYPFYGHNRRIKGLKGKNNRTLVIPETVLFSGETYTITSIGQNAFADYTNIDYVNIPSTVTKIGKYAFLRVPLLKVTIPTSVTYIADRAFGWCTKLREINIPEGVLVNYAAYSESEATVNRLGQVDGYEQEISDNRSRPRNLAFISSDVDTDIPKSAMTNENTFVVIIANEKYQEVADVEFAVRDGNMFKMYCSQVLGIPERNIHIRLNATLNHIQTELDWLKKITTVCEGDANVIVYYAGHGIPDERTRASYLLPVDGKGDNYATGFALNDLYGELGNMPVRNVTVFLDACFSGSQRDGNMLSANRGVAIKVKTEVVRGNNMVVFAAAQGDETAHSYAEKGHGLFTYFLLKKLKESKGNVTLSELGDYLRKNVNRESVLDNGNTQTPCVNVSANMGDSWKSLKLK